MFPLSWKSLAWSSPSLLQSTGSFENPSPFMLLLSGSWSHRVQGSCLPSVLQTSGRRKVRRRALSLKERSQKLPISFMVLFLCPRQSHDRSYLQGKLRGFPPVGLVRMPALPLNGCETLGKLLHPLEATLLCGFEESLTLSAPPTSTQVWPRDLNNHSTSLPW